MKQIQIQIQNHENKSQLSRAIKQQISQKETQDDDFKEGHDDDDADDEDDHDDVDTDDDNEEEDTGDDG